MGVTDLRLAPSARAWPRRAPWRPVWGRAGTVELHDVSSRGEASSAVNFSFDPQEELLVKVPLYLVKGHTHTQNSLPLFLSCSPKKHLYHTRQGAALGARV